MERGPALMQAVAERVIATYLTAEGCTDVRRTSDGGSDERGVDITCASTEGVRRIKVKADPYCGQDPSKVAERALTFYRQPTGSLALEAVADSVSRAPGWALGCDADDLYYYYLAIPLTEVELVELARGSDDDLFRGLNVDNDELLVVPMQPLATWFSSNFDRYSSRPVATKEGSGWYRLVPRTELLGSVQGARSLGSLLQRVTR